MEIGGMKRCLANWLRSVAERLSPTTYEELSAQWATATLVMHLEAMSERLNEMERLAEPPQWLAKAMVDDDGA